MISCLALAELSIGQERPLVGWIAKEEIIPCPGKNRCSVLPEPLPGQRQRVAWSSQLATFLEKSIQVAAA
jgi:hypothetical protein